MSDAKPLSREERAERLADVAHGYFTGVERVLIEQYEATVQAAEARAEAERERAERFAGEVAGHAEAGCPSCLAALAADDRHRAAQGEGT